MEIGDSIRKLRMWREMTQKELAQRIGMSANALCAIELNRPSMTFAIKEIIIDEGKEEWGALPGETYFVIKLGERL